ncbi:MAG: MerR family DNA-binding transcriptional regulator, partial [Firmicutes bacterium]|nr:MerR family DNA-binding transcriptional regulator [Bacillota bacterium]
MRMRQVIEKTGLSEKAIRFYIREGLLTPETVSGDHYNHYSFS